MAHRCCRSGYPVEACRILEMLLRGYYSYFSRDVLNSDGRRLFERMVKLLLDSNPGLRRLIYRVRRDPTIEMILRLAEEFYSCNARLMVAESLGLRQPYAYRLSTAAGDHYY
ncbi:hypothetical protein [Pyrodictium abyssi]|uniref:Uncharacterized protein n=1 Tax=Pyrodictium abyssi TaxID=54256 RepID=A0ABM8IYV3_9CREN|nr:hypothetical protein PABY_22860 [Pyrodictium abyssi]